MASDHTDLTERQEFNHKRELAHEMIPIIDRLHRKYNVVFSIFSHSLLGRDDIEIIRAHRFARHVVDRPLSMQSTLDILRILDELELVPASLDLGTLAVRFNRDPEGDLEAFIRAQLSDVIGQRSARHHRDIVLYGFERVGRLIARLLIARDSEYGGPRLRAIVVPTRGNDVVSVGALLRRDSVHGQFRGSVLVDEDAGTVTANGVKIQVITTDDPGTVDYAAHGIDQAIVVDNTKESRDRSGLERHLEAPGVARVVLVGRSEEDVKNIVFGINDHAISNSPEDRVIAAASCTTNAVAPILSAIDSRYGIRHAHIESVHAYTSDQNLLDDYHADEPRRGRAANLNVVPATTGAKEALGEVLPGLVGKVTAAAVRVPVPDVSMAALNLSLDKEVDREALNNYLRKISLYSTMKHQVDYTTSPTVVSSDFKGSDYNCIVDGATTMAQANHVSVRIWYDNDVSHARQTLRIIEHIAGARRTVLPERTEPAKL